MTNLYQIQSYFQDLILNSEKRHSCFFNTEILEIKTKNLLQIYYDDYYFRLLDLLKEDFKIVSSWLGDKQFHAIAQAYINRYPSRSYSTHTVGYQLPAFLKAAGNQQAAIVEMAEFELKVLKSLSAEEGLLLKIETLRNNIDLEQLKLTFHPSLQEQQCYYNTLDIFLAQENKKKLDSERLNMPALHIIWRFKNQACFRNLSRNEIILLETIKREQYFSAVCQEMAHLFSNEDEAVCWVASVLQQWINDGIFSQDKGN